MSEVSILELKVDIHEDDTYPDRIEELTLSMISQLQKFYNIEDIRRVPKEMAPGAKGDASAIGLLIGIAPVILPALIVFMQNWVGTNRKVTFETPNGTKVEFTADKRYSKEEIVELIEKVNQIPAAAQ